MSKARFGLTPVALLMATAWLWPATTAAAGGGCHTGASQATGENTADTVAMAEACFTPSVLHVDPGTQVRFVNKDLMTHNVSAIGWGSDSDMREGDSFTATFDQEGTFPYACMYHYGMTGAIVVGDGKGAASGIPVQPGGIVDSTPLASQQAARTVSAAEQSQALGWAIAGVAGLIVGASLAGAILRRRGQS